LFYSLSSYIATGKITDKSKKNETITVLAVTVVLMMVVVLMVVQMVMMP
jgi:uncharacterized membrane-anchored protein